jgi:hypothetical protein
VPDADVSCPRCGVHGEEGERVEQGSFTKFVVTPCRLGEDTYGSRDCARPITTAAFTPTETRPLSSASLCWRLVKLVLKKSSAYLSAVFNSATVPGCSFDEVSLKAPKGGPLVAARGYRACDRGVELCEALIIVL